MQDNIAKIEGLLMTMMLLLRLQSFLPLPMLFFSECALQRYCKQTGLHLTQIKVIIILISSDQWRWALIVHLLHAPMFLSGHFLFILFPFIMLNILSNKQRQWEPLAVQPSNCIFIQKSPARQPFTTGNSDIMSKIPLMALKGHSHSTWN